MRVLITGANGFAGRHLAPLCRRMGGVVVAVSREPNPVDGAEEVIVADLRDADATSAAVARARPERVFHLAADASVAASWRSPAQLLENNMTSSLSVLEAVREHVPQARVLVAGSGEEYGAPERLPVAESAPLRPQNPYAVSKAAVDLLAGFYQDAHGMHVIRTRAFNHAGPGQADAYVASAFARQIAEAEGAGSSEARLAVGNLEAKRDFTDVRDVVRAYWLLLDRAEVGAYNVCSGVATAITDILAGLGRHARVEVHPETDPALLREHEVMEIRGSNTKLIEATGWRPEIPLSRTLRDVLDWWRARADAEAAS